MGNADEESIGDIHIRNETAIVAHSFRQVEQASGNQEHDGNHGQVFEQAGKEILEQKTDDRRRH
jgi:hypothetical protein